MKLDLPAGVDVEIKAFGRPRGERSEAPAGESKPR